MEIGFAGTVVIAACLYFISRAIFGERAVIIIGSIIFHLFLIGFTGFMVGMFVGILLFEQNPGDVTWGLAFGFLSGGLFITQLLFQANFQSFFGHPPISQRIIISTIVFLIDLLLILLVVWVMLRQYNTLFH